MKKCMMMCLALALLSGCITWEDLPAWPPPQPPPVPEVPAPEPLPPVVIDLSPQEPVTSGEIDLSRVVWLHTDVSGWPVTRELRAVAIGSGSITLDYNTGWPRSNFQGTAVDANPWVFVQIDGQWYAATWEWLRPGQTTKSRSSVNGDHIKKSPLSSWAPKSGERLGFMVSGLARTSLRNAKERTNILMVYWP